MTPPATALMRNDVDADLSAIAHSPYGKTMPGHEAVIEVLKEEGVEVIFGYPGGAIMPIYDALEKVPHDMEHILTASEGGAGHAAAGYAGATGKTGVLFVTSGPGLTNAITPIADAQGDSRPMVVISGQVPTNLIGTDAFQEVPATQITQPITKHNMLISKAEDLVPGLRRAFYLAAEGRPGVVHVDIPKDIQNTDVMFTHREKQKPRPIFAHVADPSAGEFQQVAQMMAEAKRPVFYIGGGVIHAGPKASQTLRELIDETGFPATQTLMGLGAYPTTHPSHLGMLGMHGAYEANMAMHEADLIIAVGARFDDRVTGKVYDAAGKRLFAPKARIIQMDIDAAEINKIIRVDAALRGDAATLLKGVQSQWRTQRMQADPAVQGSWWGQINQWRQVRSFDINPDEAGDIRAQSVLQQLGQVLAAEPDYIVATNVGQHQMWAAQYLPFSKPRQLLTSGKVGTMGFGLPAAMGGQYGRPHAPVVMITGDGSWRMNTTDAETACRYGLPVKTVMLNNDSLNMVGQWQRGFHGGRMSQSSFKNSSKDFIAEFKAQGREADGERVSDPAQVMPALKRMMAHSGPYLLEIAIRNEDCYPIVPAGSAHNQMKFSQDVYARNPGLRPSAAQ